jgi:hypothetical protein
VALRQQQQQCITGSGARVMHHQYRSSGCVSSAASALASMSTVAMQGVTAAALHQQQWQWRIGDAWMI